MDLVPIMIRSMTRTAAYVTEEEQQELCQIGYLALCRSAVGFEEGRSFQPYAKTIIRHAIFDYWRKIARDRSMLCSLDEASSEDEHLHYRDLFSYEDTQTTHPEKDTNQTLLLEHLTQLGTGQSSTIQKGIVALYLQQQGYTSFDLAKHYQVPANRVRAWQSKARKLLQQDDALYALLTLTLKEGTFMLTLYTAVGTLKFQKTTGGKSIPLVINDGQEYGLSDDELLLWSCLAFQILTLHELQDAYTLRQIQKEGPKGLSFQHYLNRLSLRGLVVSGIGLTGVDALYRLLGSLTIIPLKDTFPIRLFGCVQLYLEGTIGAKEFGRYLKKKPSSPMEDTILKLADKVSLTTAELVTSMEQEKVIHNESDIMDELYTEPETTYQTLVDDVQIHHTQYPVLQAIANLYLNKQITFHTC